MADWIRQVPAFLAAFLVTGAVLLGGRAFYVAHIQQSPFVKAAGTMPGVARVKVPAAKTVDVWLKPGAHPAAVYESVGALATSSLGTSSEIHLMDNPSPEEAALGQRVSLMVAEAEADGNYVAMAADANQLAATHHQSLTWTVGPHDVFVSLSAGAHRFIAVYPLNWVARTPAAN